MSSDDPCKDINQEDTLDAAIAAAKAKAGPDAEVDGDATCEADSRRRNLLAAVAVINVRIRVRKLPISRLRVLGNELQSSAFLAEVSV